MHILQSWGRFGHATPAILNARESITRIILFTHMNPRRLLTQSALVIGAVLLSAGIQTFAFTQPNTAPPNAAVYAPLTTSSDGQSKLGGLALNQSAVPAPIGLVVNGATKLGSTTAACDASTAGSIIFTPAGFMGCTGTAWAPFGMSIPAGSTTLDWNTACTAPTCTTLANGSRQFSFTVPAGVTNLKTIQVWGAGGGGAAGSGANIIQTAIHGAGAGGGGGAYALSQNVSVTPGQEIVVVVGAGGAGGTDNLPEYACGWPCDCAYSVAGGDSSVTIGGTQSITAGGGSRACGYGGAGGTVSSSGGIVLITSASGSPGSNGGCTYNASCGGNGGAGANGGAGGLRTCVDPTSATSGTAPGGGGGGGYCGNGTYGGTHFGAAGAPGKVYISW